MNFIEIGSELINVDSIESVVPRKVMAVSYAIAGIHLRSGRVINTTVCYEEVKAMLGYPRPSEKES